MDDLGASVILQARGWILRPAGGQWELWESGEKARRIAGPAADWPTLVIAHDATVTGAALDLKFRKGAFALWAFHRALSQTVPAIDRPEYIRPRWINGGNGLDFRCDVLSVEVPTDRTQDVVQSTGHLNEIEALEARMTTYGITYANIPIPNGG